jgi:hypothetical protein
VESSAARWAALERVARLATELLPLVDRAFMTCYRRQQELVWTEDLIEDIENELESAGMLVGPSGCRRCAFWTWSASPG